ncbi:hypothetical protein Goari_001138 [Gossypium aridum]|uniref:FBD domain-containing protein n=1 Tax=Gossypium aridum TaxID=34290 RepID=A0A7J8YIS4_GOSAI|nr:hypothetical protein [Gossypium aridum]
MAKKVESVRVLDRISSISDPILCRILSFLPVKDAVRTSILSPRWRYLFASSMSILDFEECLQGVSKEKFNNFNHFVDRLLYIFPNQVSLECFRVDDEVCDVDSLRLYGWICATLWRGVKEIEIYFEKSPMLPTQLFTSHSLVTLKLRFWGDLNVPTKVCLPNLRTLHLKVFTPSNDSVFRLVSGCLALEDLLMVPGGSCLGKTAVNIHSPSLKRLVLDFHVLLTKFPNDIDYVVKINAPSLECFEYNDSVGDFYTLSSMKLLEEADILISRYQEDERNATRLLQAICNVQSLFLSIIEAETVFRSRLDPVLLFPSLVFLDFCNEGDDWQGTWLVEFLHCLPHLKKLVLTFATPKRGLKSLPKTVPSCLLFELEEIEILRFEEDEHMFELVGFFLSHALVLKNLVINFAGKVGEEYQCRLSVKEKLLSLSMGSKTCEIVFCY